LDKVLDEAEKAEGKVPQGMLEESVNVLHSLRMLSLHVVRCIVEWRKQLMYNFLFVTGG
jgi:hypothetical protein